MKGVKNFTVGKFSIQFGWFRGEAFTLIKIGVGEFYTDMDNVCLFEFQITKFCFNIMWEK
jgi:hypothetical protein